MMGLHAGGRATYNISEGSGLESNSMTSDLRRAATTRGPEVAASIEVVAR